MAETAASVKEIWLHGQAVKTRPSQGRITGSIPVGVIAPRYRIYAVPGIFSFSEKVFVKVFCKSRGRFFVHSLPRLFLI